MRDLCTILFEKFSQKIKFNNENKSENKIMEIDCN